MSLIKIKECSSDLALHYPGQINLQGAYIELDCETGVLSADTDGEIGGGMPFAVWHGRTLRWPCPALTADAANALLSEVAPLAEKVLAGYEIDYDGNNSIGKFLTDYARDAALDINILCSDCDGDTLSVLDAGDWLLDPPAELTAGTTDDEIEALADKLEEEAGSELIMLRKTMK